MVKKDYEGRAEKYNSIQNKPSQMRKTPYRNWYKEKWDKHGRWYNYAGKSEIAIGDNFSGVIHIFNNGQSIKVVKTKKQAKMFVKNYMKKHPNG